MELFLLLFGMAVALLVALWIGSICNSYYMSLIGEAYLVGILLATLWLERNTYKMSFVTGA
jgi:hypothetical protein